MLYKQLKCPTCGNYVTAKSIIEPQMCKWCKSFFKTTITRRNKEGIKGKYTWTIDCIVPDNFKN